MKKLSLLLALCLLLTGLATTAGAAAVSAANEFPIVDEPITLTAWSQEMADRNYDTCLMTTALEELTGIHIDWQLYSSSETPETMFNLSIASGDYPDLYLGMSFKPAQIEMCIEGGVALPLNDLIEEHGHNFKIALEENPGYRDMLTASDGNIYTFMYTDSGVHKDSEYKMYYYKPWLEALGMEAPTTPEEFKEYLIAIRDNDVNGNGDPSDEIPLVGYYNGRQSDPICFLMNPFELYTQRYYYINDDGEIIFTANSDGWREGLKYIADLYSEGLIAEETYVQDDTQFRAMLNKPAEEMVVGMMPFWYQGAVIDTTVMNWTDFEPLAPLKGEKQQTAARFGGNFNLNAMISTQCENPEAAFKMLDYLIGEEGLYFGFYGVEGESYEWVDEPSYYGGDTSIRRITTDIETLWNSGTAPRYDKAEARYATTMDESQIDSQDNTYVLVHAAQVYEPYYVNHHIPDVVWADADTTQAVTDYQQLFEDYIKSMDTQFVMGVLDINDDAVWNDYVQSLNDMGLEDYLANLEVYYGLK